MATWTGSPRALELALAGVILYYNMPVLNVMASRNLVIKTTLSLNIVFFLLQTVFLSGSETLGSETFGAETLGVK